MSTPGPHCSTGENDHLKMLKMLQQMMRPPLNLKSLSYAPSAKYTLRKSNNYKFILIKEPQNLKKITQSYINQCLPPLRDEKKALDGGTLPVIHHENHPCISF